LYFNTLLNVFSSKYVNIFTISEAGVTKDKVKPAPEKKGLIYFKM